MSDRISELIVEGLFGRMDHTVSLQTTEHTTILTGPNGTGKTHILRVLRSLVALDFQAWSALPLDAAEVAYESGRRLRVENVQSDSGTTASITGFNIGGDALPPFKIANLAARLEGLLPHYIGQFDEGLWVDERDGEILDLDDLQRRFGPRLRRGQFDLSATEEDVPPEYTVFKPPAPPTLIETGRLDLTDSRELRGGRVVRRPGARIHQYVERIQEQVSEARRASLAVSQQVDRQFAARALDKARATVREGEIRARFESLADLHQELHASGLTAESPGVAFPEGRTNPTERRILTVFLEDWEAKLQPLVPAHQKLQLFRQIVGEKMKDKSLDLGGGDLRFTIDDGSPLPVESLSTGEQHLMALYAMLLFYAHPGTLVLIDEPEISLHAAWKHAFLDDVTRVAEINDLQIVTATHSTGIINGRWELVDELSLAN